MVLSDEDGYWRTGVESSGFPNKYVCKLLIILASHSPHWNQTMWTAEFSFLDVHVVLCWAGWERIREVKSKAAAYIRISHYINFVTGLEEFNTYSYTA
jgi:hypothetical protein